MSTPRRRVAIIGSNGLRATYGGWDQLVNNLVDLKSPDIAYLVFNPTETPVPVDVPPDVEVRQLPLRATGFQGLFFDYWSILLAFRRVDAVLLLGVQPMPLLVLLRLFWRVTIVVNVGGIEWERPQFGRAAKWYLKCCFWLSLRFARCVVLDNLHHRTYLPPAHRAAVALIPYGGAIDTTLEPTPELRERYPFLEGPYCLSISRSVADNQLEELCAAFAGTRHRLVLISNFSRSEYGRRVLETYRTVHNLTLIDGLYVKPELDLIRRHCTAYIHTHVLCGTAPSLVEMIVARRPIVSIDVPQNRYTLDGAGAYFADFRAVMAVVDQPPAALGQYVPPSALVEAYGWDRIVRQYERTYDAG